MSATEAGETVNATMNSRATPASNPLPVDHKSAPRRPLRPAGRSLAPPSVPGGGSLIDAIAGEGPRIPVGTSPSFLRIVEASHVRLGFYLLRSFCCSPEITRAGGTRCV